MNIFTEDDIDDLKKTNPDIYNIIIEKIFNDDTNIFVTKKVNGTDVKIKKRGLQVLAIPSNATIPEWAIPYIDINTMVNNIIAPFKAVLEIFNNKFTSEGKTRNGVNRKTDKLTNIIKF